MKEDKQYQKTYSSWSRIRQYCQSTSSSQYGKYGATGVYRCDRWKYFKNFLEDMGLQEEGTVLKLVKGDCFNKENCEWVKVKRTLKEVYTSNKNENSDVVKLLTYRNKTQTIKEWGKELNISVRTINSRLYRGWSIEDTLTKEVRKINDIVSLKNTILELQREGKSLLQISKDLNIRYHKIRELINGRKKYTKDKT